MGFCVYLKIQDGLHCRSKLNIVPYDKMSKIIFHKFKDKRNFDSMQDSFQNIDIQMIEPKTENKKKMNKNWIVSYKVFIFV